MAAPTFDRPVFDRPVAPQAWPGTLVLGVLALGALLLGWVAVAGVFVVLALANVAFFRNPTRHPPEGDDLVLSPADGRVVEVAKLPENDPFVGPALRIAIFLSVLDVHINRVPLSGKVRAQHRSGSKFLAAFRHEASESNVQARLDIETASGVRFAVSQITGLIARRIVCPVSEGDDLERGSVYGLICYGSRVEILLPSSAEARVALGDRVRGGESVLAEVAS